MKGYDQLRESAAWHDLTGRGKIKLIGEDRARLLHAMTTNNIQQLQTGQGCYAFFLSAQGRILGDSNILCFADHFLLDTEPEIAEKMYQHLDRFLIADDVTLEDLTPALVTIAVEGPRSAAILTASGAPVPSAEYTHATWGARTVARLNYTGSRGYFVIAPAAEKDDIVRALETAGAIEADREAFEVVRLEHGKPRYGDDLSERYLSQESNQMHALNFNKGCYLGQEIVERVRARAQIHRRLWPVLIETTDAPPSGSKLTSGDKPAGEITSSAYSPGLGKVVALAYVRVEFERPGTELQFGSAKAVVAGPAQPEPCRP
jgi:tRNA-modifying protein YgfZ